MTNYDKILQYALRIISKKRYTVSEMHKKLTRYIKKQESFHKSGEDGDVESSEPAETDSIVESVLERLLELDYLNDGKFVGDYISDRIKLKPRGRLLIEKELRIKGIAKYMVESAFSSIGFDEAEVAKDALFRKFSQWKRFPREKQKEKAYRFLRSRGFNGGAIYKTIESCYSKSSFKDL